MLAAGMALSFLLVACSGSDDDRAGKRIDQESTSPVSTASPSTSASPTAPSHPENGPDPYWPLDGNAGTDALHYDIQVSYDLASGRLDGDTTVTMQATDEVATLSLDLLLPVKTVHVDGKEASFDTGTRHEVLITPPAPIASGRKFDVRVTYAGVPSRAEYDGESSWLADDQEVVTMNEPHMAPWWYPSNDHPSDKATFDVRVTAVKEKVVVGNGVRVGRTEKGDTATTHWRMSDPMTTYLAFFAIGDFEVEEGTSPSGIPVYNAVSRDLPDASRASAWASLRQTAAITDWLQQRLGRYPFATTGGLVTSLDVGFALENQTRSTYGDWIYPSVVVHEVAHQWFGDSVSVQGWRDIWLNEGFATYLEADYAAAHGGPPVDEWLHDAYDDRCQHPDDDFWELDLSDPGADSIFDAAVYDRGALVLGALRNRIGDDDFDALLKGWVRDHEDRNATVAQFEEQAETVSGEDLDGFFDAWLRGGTAPKGTEDNGLDHACP